MMKQGPKFSPPALRRARVAKSLTQQAASTAAGVSLTTWRNAERGGVTSLPSLEKMVAALGVQLADVGMKP